MIETSCSGVISPTSCHTGLPATLPSRSHAALPTAPVARCIAPLSGPIQRSWLSDDTCRHVVAHHAIVERLDCSHHDLIAATDGEGQPVPLLRPVRLEDHIGGRVI